MIRAENAAPELGCVCFHRSPLLFESNSSKPNAPGGVGVAAATSCKLNSFVWSCPSDFPAEDLASEMVVTAPQSEKQAKNKIKVYVITV